jgi:hypothetical protein
MEATFSLALGCWLLLNKLSHMRWTSKVNVWMRVSEQFKLDRTQPSLDFVDVDVEDDVPVFIDPRALRLLPSLWASECVSLIQHFFRTVIAAIRDGNHDKAKQLLSALREPNETHLGLSRGRSRGRALGDDTADDVWEALSKSEAAKSGLLEDLEDTILMVEGVGADIVSDIATNLIREPLIHYTQDACRTYGIPMAEEVPSGAIWNPATNEWNAMYVELPTVNGKRLILVPKVLVRRRMDYDAEEYYRSYIIEFLRQQEMERNSSLVRLLKDGRPKVTVKSLEEKYGRGKATIVRETLKHPELLQRYRAAKSAKIAPPLSHLDIATSGGTPAPEWDKLLSDVRSIPTGATHAVAYEKAIEILLTALFYPALSSPQSQFEIHDGRKRIDISYTNVADRGFFRWLSLHYPSSLIFVECKNYSKDIANPELDQLTGRFSVNRGRFGIVVCRSFEDKDLFIQRCVDTAKDQRGFVVPLDDGDLELLVTAVKNPTWQLEFDLISERFQRLIR